jgi:hypothetical protein
MGKNEVWTVLSGKRHMKHPLDGAPVQWSQVS